jgi:hypothetical protein
LKIAAGFKERSPAFKEQLSMCRKSYNGHQMQAQQNQTLRTLVNVPQMDNELSLCRIGIINVNASGGVHLLFEAITNGYCRDHAPWKVE